MAISFRCSNFLNYSTIPGHFGASLPIASSDGWPASLTVTDRRTQLVEAADSGRAKLDGLCQAAYIYSNMKANDTEIVLRIPSAEELRRALEKVGCRVTRQRAAVFGYLRSVDSHPTAEQVCSAVRREIPDISLATVYKALEALVEAGLAAKLADAAGPARYDCRGDAHYHLRCARTGQVRDLPTPFDPHLPDKLDPSLVEALRRQGFHITSHRLELVGYFQD
jgi:Fe2+ or Zn2+ uptake regulation protein